MKASRRLSTLIEPPLRRPRTGEQGETQADKQSASDEDLAPETHLEVEDCTLEAVAAELLQHRDQIKALTKAQPRTQSQLKVIISAIGALEEKDMKRSLYLIPQDRDTTPEQFHDAIDDVYDQKGSLICCVHRFRLSAQVVIEDAAMMSNMSKWVVTNYQLHCSPARSYSESHIQRPSTITHQYIKRLTSTVQSAYQYAKLKDHSCNMYTLGFFFEKPLLCGMMVEVKNSKNPVPIYEIHLLDNIAIEGQFLDVPKLNSAL